MLSEQQKQLLAYKLQAAGVVEKSTMPASATPQWQPEPQHWHEPFPLTDVQYAYWLGRMASFQLGQVGSHGYQEWRYASLDVARYEQAWNRLIARHDMLRAVIYQDGLQRVLPEVPWFTIPCTDCRQSSEAQQRQVRQQHREQLSHRCYDAAVWPGFSVHAVLLKGGAVRLHISADALFGDVYSSLILRRELQQLYDFPERPLPALNFAFRDYVCWIKSTESSEDFAKSQRWWRKKVATLPSAPPLPWLKNLPQTPCFTRLSSRLPAEQWQRLQLAGRRQGLSPSCLILSAYAWILRLWSGTQDFTINLTLFNRTLIHPDVAGLMGDFTHTLLFGCHLQAEDDFLTAARRIQQDFIADFEHRHYSGVRVLRDYAQASQNGQPNSPLTLMPVVFTSALGVEPTDAALEAIASLEFEITQTPQVLIDHQVFEAQGELVMQWDVVEAAFPQGVLADMFTTMQSLITKLADQPAAWQTPVVVGLPACQLQTREAVNATAIPIAPALLHAAACQRLQEDPAVCAIDYAGEIWTRGQVWQWVQRIAARLWQGGQPHEFVALLLPHGPLQVAAVLGVNLAGCAFVPLDMDWPVSRRERILSKSAIRQVLVADGKISLPAGVEAIMVDDQLATPARPFVAPQTPPTAPAYVIFTSGSTGEPKGVVMSHQAAWNTLADIQQRFAIHDQDKVLGVSALTFDLSVFDIFGLLGAGGCLVMPQAGRERDIEHWRDLIASRGVTLWNSVPALLELLLAQPSDLSTLRLIMLSGDWIAPALSRHARQTCPAAHLLSLGGATEAGIWSVYYSITELPDGWHSVPYGTPLANQRLYVLDQQMQPAPDWVAGDLYIAGNGLADGYLHDPQRSASAFIRDTNTMERLYRTGDRARYRPNGLLEFLGRSDNQIKLGGYRIEPGEIEAAMLCCPGISHALVIVAGCGRQRRLIGYVCGSGDLPALYDHLRCRVPAYMIPAHIEWLEALPLTANGKIDRQRLPLPQHSPMSLPSIAATPTEQRLLSLLSEELGHTVSDLQANLFDLGASSMTVVNLHQRLVREGNSNLSLMTLFQRTCIRDLAATLDETQQTRPSLDVAEQRAVTRAKQISQRQQSRLKR